MSAIVKPIHSNPDSSITEEQVKMLFLTEKQIRAYPQFKDVTEEEIINIINSLHQLAVITYELVSAELNNPVGITQVA